MELISSDINGNLYISFSDSKNPITWQPEPQLPKAPQHLPDDIEKPFLRAQKLIAMPDDMFSEAGNVFRKTLERAIAHIAPNLNGTLNNKIDQLVAKDMLVPTMGKFAHAIRELGNEATHGKDDLSREEVTNLALFTDFFAVHLHSPSQTP